MSIIDVTIITGAPSPMQNLEGDNAKVVESYAMMYRKDRREHRFLELTALKRLAKGLPALVAR